MKEGERGQKEEGGLKEGKLGIVEACLLRCWDRAKDMRGEEEGKG